MIIALRIAKVLKMLRMSPVTCLAALVLQFLSDSSAVFLKVHFCVIVFSFSRL